MTWILRQPGACTCPRRPVRNDPATRGDLWECDSCGQLWEYVRFGGGDGGVWVHAGRRARRRAERIKSAQRERDRCTWRYGPFICLLPQGHVGAHTEDL